MGEVELNLCVAHLVQSAAEASPQAAPGTRQDEGREATGGQLAAPVVAEFMREALREVAATPFRVPAGIQLIPIDPNTGERAAYGDPNVILEAFKPGEDPATEPLVIGGTMMPVSAGEAGAEGGLTTGTGGLY